jgi:hypothetical protein
LIRDKTSRRAGVAGHNRGAFKQKFELKGSVINNGFTNREYSACMSTGSPRLLVDQESVILVVMATSGHDAPGNRHGPWRYQRRGSEGDMKRTVVAGGNAGAYFAQSIPDYHYSDEKEISSQFALCSQHLFWGARINPGRPRLLPGDHTVLSRLSQTAKHTRKLVSCVRTS